MARKKTLTTSAGLCDALFDELDLVRNGESDPHRASAVAKLAIQIINTKRLEMEAAIFLKDGMKLSPIALRANGLALGTAR